MYAAVCDENYIADSIILGEGKRLSGKVWGSNIQFDYCTIMTMLFYEGLPCRRPAPSKPKVPGDGRPATFKEFALASYSL